jgi:hypothetical protein
MRSTDVTLPKSVRPIFPDRCVGCGVPDPGYLLRLGALEGGWRLLAGWVFGARFLVDVPVCTVCGPQIVRQRRLRRFVCGMCVIAGVSLAVYVLGNILIRIKRWLAMGIVLACMIPWFLYETYWPRPIQLRAFPDSIDYQFRDEEYAEEFRSLNGDDDVENEHEDGDEL